jgi:ferritin
MIGKKVSQAINKQVNAELYSGYLYQSMATWAAFKGYPGTAKWLEAQAQEEFGHAKKMSDYLADQGDRAVLTAIDGPPTDFASVMDVFEKTLEHERKVTAAIGKIVDLAAAEKDHATSIFYQWFVTEQVEEEKNASEILQRLQLVGGSVGALFYLDKELGKRKGGE